MYIPNRGFSRISLKVVGKGMTQYTYFSSPCYSLNSQKRDCQKEASNSQFTEENGLRYIISPKERRSMEETQWGSLGGKLDKKM
jgi:hypothetical protein